MIFMEIPNYEVKEIIGKGGMATVYRAMHQLLKQERAIKIMFSSLSNEPGFEKNFLHEGQIVASLNHPHIVKIHDVGRCDEGYFMAMEYLTGGSLGDKIHKSPLALEDALLILQQIGGALHYAHQQGLIHRDIKPNNILFSKNGHAVLTDFGISKLQDTESDLTRYGYGRLGTPRYMSPEQTTSSTLDHRSDIYSLALVFYEMLIGKPGIQAKTTVSIIREHVLLPPPTLPPVYAYLQPVLDKALAKEAKDRYATVKEFVNAIIAKKPEENNETVIISNLEIENQNLDKVTTEVPLSEQTEKNKKSYKIVGLLFVFLVLVGTSAWLVIKPNNKVQTETDIAKQTLPQEPSTNITPPPLPLSVIPQKEKQPADNSNIAITEQTEKTVNDAKEKEEIVVTEPPCQTDSEAIEDGVECFDNKSFDNASNIFSRIIENHSNISQYLKATMYLALISIEKNEDTLARQKIQHLYFMNSKFDLKSYNISNQKYYKIFNQVKNIATRSGDSEIDPISKSKFIRVNTCLPPCSDGFWIGEKEISQAQWYNMMPNKKDNDNKKAPIRDITWEHANQFAIKVKKRLCTTKEWLEALKSVKPSSYDNAIIGQSGWSPSPVDQGEKGDTGITNLIGNIMEFTTQQNKPAYIGLYWSQMPEGDLLEAVKKSNKKASLKTKSFNIGIRLCN